MIEPHVSFSPRLSRRGFAMLLCIAMGIVLVRGYFIGQAQSPRWDDNYHLSRGADFWLRNIGYTFLNDPPLGEAISALPLVVNLRTGDRGDWHGIYGHRLGFQGMLTMLALWKSLLLLPMLWVIARWLDEMYGAMAAIVGVAAIVFEPTFAAHTPLPAIDVLGVEAIVLSLYAAWRYWQLRTRGWLIALCAGVTAALSIKHTAVPLPAAIGLLAMLIAWRHRPLPWRIVCRQVLFAAMLCALFMWAFTMFDVSRVVRVSEVPPTKTELSYWLQTPVPGAMYIRSFISGLKHVNDGHSSYLLGEQRAGGWWYYFPVIATYKLPFGLLALLLGGALTFIWKRPAKSEWFVLIPLAVFLAAALGNRVNIGFRHFLPVLALMLMLTSRLATTRRGAIVALACLAIAAIETTRWHPDYLSYANRERAYLVMSDSNIDWGQSLKHVREWSFKQNPDRPISLAHFGDTQHVGAYMKDTRVNVVMQGLNVQIKEQPRTGLFVVSPVWLVSAYDKKSRLAWLRDETPIETIGGCMLVYDLDAISAKPPTQSTISKVSVRTANAE